MNNERAAIKKQGDGERAKRGHWSDAFSKRLKVAEKYALPHGIGRYLMAS